MADGSLPPAFPVSKPRKAPSESPAEGLPTHPALLPLIEALARLAARQEFERMQEEAGH